MKLLNNYIIIPLKSSTPQYWLFDFLLILLLYRYINTIKSLQHCSIISLYH